MYYSMNTRHIAEEYRLSHWAQIRQNRSESGLSIKAFCKNAGIHENTYYYWQRKLRASACEQLAKMAPAIEQTGLAQPVFTEVKMPDDKKPEPSADVALQGNLNIEISGVKISAGSSYPVNQLAHLLRGLAHQC